MPSLFTPQKTRLFNFPLSFIYLITIVIVLNLLTSSHPAFAQVEGGGATSAPTTTASPNTGSGSSTATACLVTKVGAPDPSVPTPVCINSSSGGGPAGPCQRAPEVNYTVAQYEDAILLKWNIDFSGLDLDQMEMIWQEFHEIDCTGFLQDLKGTTIERWDNGWSQQFSDPSKPGVDIKFGNHHGEFVKGLITHELTHVWQFYSTRGEENLLDTQGTYEGEGGLTVYSRRECSNTLFLPALDRIYHEDQADMNALYLNPSLGEMTCSDAPNPFNNGAHPQHRAVAEKGVGKK